MKLIYSDCGKTELWRTGGKTIKRMLTKGRGRIWLASTGKRAPNAWRYYSEEDAQRLDADRERLLPLQDIDHVFMP